LHFSILIFISAAKYNFQVSIIRERERRKKEEKERERRKKKRGERKREEKEKGERKIGIGSNTPKFTVRSLQSMRANN
jgi:hypothetical protein